MPCGKAGALTLSLVAEENGVIVGHVALSPMTVAINPRALRVLALGPIAVAPPGQRRGIGRALIRHALEAARTEEDGAVILLGSVDYYSRSGFEPATARGLSWGNGAHDGHLQVIGLVPGALDGLSGAVCYHAAFAAL